MGSLLLISRLLLAGVFVLAGLAKLLDRVGSRQAILEFGVPPRFAALLAILLPLAELAAAVLLVPVTTAWWGALAAFMLLLLFVVGIGINLALGRKPDCHCFGQLYSAPVGWSTLVRNAVLATIAGFVVWQGWGDAGPSAVSWLGLLTIAEMVSLVTGLVMLGLLAVEGWFLFHLLRQNGRLLLRIEVLEAKLASDGTEATPLPAQPTAGLPIGTSAPTFRLSGLYGEILTLDALLAIGKPVLLIFSDPGCGPCNALLPAIAGWQRDHASVLTIVLISRSTTEANLAKSAQHGLIHVLLQEDREVAQAYRANGTPSAVIVRPDGTISSLLSMGAEEIQTLMAQSVRTPTPAEPVPAALAPTPVQPIVPAPASSGGCGCGNGNGNGNGHNVALARPAPKIGEQAPTLKLPDLTGRSIDLVDFRGSQTLVLFWNPGCGFCKRMLDDLKAWERNPPKEAPKLLVVSAGTAEENQAMGLRSPVVLDQGFSIGQTFGASGTPSAVLIDATGNIASQVVSGAPAVLANLG